MNFPWSHERSQILGPIGLAVLTLIGIQKDRQTSKAYIQKEEALRSYIYMLAIAGQTAGPNRLNFLGNPWVSFGVT